MSIIDEEGDADYIRALLSGANAMLELSEMANSALGIHQSKQLVEELERRLRELEDE